MHGACTICGKHDYLQPLHGDKGGPPCCILCSGNWHGKHGRRRRLGRIVIRAMAAYLKGGGDLKDIDGMKATAATFDLVGGGGLDPLGYFADSGGIGDETVELTSELLADAIKIAHPDLHPLERRDLAHRVTQGLLALQPFTFPALKPKPKPEPSSAQREGSSEVDLQKLKLPSYPCKECRGTIPFYFCMACKTEWESRQRKKDDKERAKRRDQYKRRKQRRERWKRPTICEVCGVEFKGKRADARYCSATCRQRAHRGVTDKKVLPPIRKTRVTEPTTSLGVTDKKKDAGRPQNTRDMTDDMTR